MSIDINSGTLAASSIKARPKRKPGKTLALGVLGLGALMGAAVWAGQWWSVGRFIESTNDAYLQADSLSVAAKISGTVSEVYVSDNQTVSVGQPLVRLDRLRERRHLHIA